MSDTRTLTERLGRRFIQRKDVKSWQYPDGQWRPERSPMTMADFEAHFAGNKTMGHYMLDPDGNCKFFAFDLDLVKHSRECQDTPTVPGQPACKGCPMTFPVIRVTEQNNAVADEDLPQITGIPRDLWTPEMTPAKQTLAIHLQCMAHGLALRIHRSTGLHVAIATSGGKGLHVYGFTGTMPASAVRTVALGILEDIGVYEPFRGQNFWRHKNAFEVLDIEVFPKQDNLNGKDLGNLMKLPLGVHRVTGQRAEFISVKGKLGSMRVMDPIDALDGDLPWE